MSTDLTDKPPADEFIFVIATSEYAGNFERHLAAFLTGEVGDCSVGFESSEFFGDEADDDEKLFIERALVHTPDDHGTFRPVSIWPTPGQMKTAADGSEYPAYNSVALIFREPIPEEFLNLWTDRAVRFGKNPQDFGCHKFVPSFEVRSCRLVKKTVHYENSWIRLVR